VYNAEEILSVLGNPGTIIFAEGPSDEATGEKVLDNYYTVLDGNHIQSAQATTQQDSYGNQEHVVSLMFDDVFLADTVNTGEWFFGSLQPRYTKLRQDLISLNEVIHEELMTNSADFDAGFYRSIMPGIVAIGAGFLLIILLFYFIMVYYVKPIYRMSDGIDGYRLSGRRHVYEFDGDDQLANINSGVTELIEENVELKKRIKNFRDERERLLQNISDLSAE
jgi:hypothetical protein